MININTFSNELFQILSEYIKNKSIYRPYVFTNVVDNKYPLVVFENNLNLLGEQTKDRVYQTRQLTFEISIYAINNKNVDSRIICDELSQLVVNVMQGYYFMQGGIDAKISNINTAKATKYVLHFNCEWFMLRNYVF